MRTSSHSAVRILARWALRGCVWAVVLGLPWIGLAPDLQIRDLKPVGTNSTWRLRWESIPGTDYQVQRIKDDRINASGANSWLPLLTIRATNSITTADGQNFRLAA